MTSEGTAVRVLVNGTVFDVTVHQRSRNGVRFEYRGREYLVELPAEVTSTTEPPLNRRTGAAARKGAPMGSTSSSHSSGNISSGGDPSGAGAIRIQAPLPGVIVSVAVAAGDVVEDGTVLLHIEAMKMHNAIVATGRGIVHLIHVQPGQEVSDGQPLVDLVPE